MDQTEYAGVAVANTTDAMEATMEAQQTITDMIANAADRLVKVDARLSNLAEHVAGTVDASIAGEDSPPSLMSTAHRLNGGAEDVCNTVARLQHLLVLQAPLTAGEVPDGGDERVTVRDIVTHATTRLSDAVGGLASLMARVDGAEPESEIGLRGDTLRGDVERVSDLVERLGAMAECLIASVGTK